MVTLVITVLVPGGGCSAAGTDWCLAVQKRILPAFPVLGDCCQCVGDPRNCQRITGAGEVDPYGRNDGAAGAR